LSKVSVNSSLLQLLWNGKMDLGGAGHLYSRLDRKGRVRVHYQMIGKYFNRVWRELCECQSVQSDKL
jgi:hypothetical protein